MTSSNKTQEFPCCISACPWLETSIEINGPTNRKICNPHNIECTALKPGSLQPWLLSWAAPHHQGHGNAYQLVEECSAHLHGRGLGSQDGIYILRKCLWTQVSIIEDSWILMISTTAGSGCSRPFVITNPAGRLINRKLLSKSPVKYVYSKPIDYNWRPGLQR